MSEWKEIASQKDIEELLYTCGGFHDTCIVSVNYRSGAFVDEKNAMHFGTCNDHELTVVLHGQWEPGAVELCFTGVRQFHLAGWRENYTSEILEGYLSFYEGSWEGRQERLIVWSDFWGFDFSQRDAAKDEQTDTYIVADKMKWRTAGNGATNISLEK